MEGVAKFKYDKEQDDELSLNIGDEITNIKKIEEGWCEGTINGVRGMFPENFVELKSVSAAKVEPSEPFVLRDDTSETTRKRRAKVAFSYTADNDDELTLTLGTVVEIIEEEEEGWWRGRYDGKEGVFPSNFVELIEEDTEPPPYTNMSVTATKQTEKVRPPSMVAMPGLGGINPFELKQKLKPVVTNSPPSQNINNNEPSPPIKTVNKNVQLQKAKVMFSYNADQDDEITIKEGDIVEIISMNTEQDGWWKIRLGQQEGFVPDNFLSLLPTTTQPVIDTKPTTSLDNPPLPPKTSAPMQSTKPKPPPSSSNLPKLPGKLPAELPKLPPKQPDTHERRNSFGLDVPRQDILNNDKVKEKPKRVVRPPSRNPSAVDVTEENENKPPASVKAPWQDEISNKKKQKPLPVAQNTPPPVKPTPPKPAIKPAPKPSKPPPNKISEPPSSTVAGTPPKPPVGNRVLPPTLATKEENIIATKAKDHVITEPTVAADAAVWKEAFEELQAKFKQFQDELRQEMHKEITILANDLDSERKKVASMQIDIDRLKKTREYRDNI